MLSWTKTSIGSCVTRLREDTDIGQFCRLLGGGSRTDTRNGNEPVYLLSMFIVLIEELFDLSFDLFVLVFEKADVILNCFSIASILPLVLS